MLERPVPQCSCKGKESISSTKMRSPWRTSQSIDVSNPASEAKRTRTCCCACSYRDMPSYSLLGPTSLLKQHSSYSGSFFWRIVMCEQRKDEKIGTSLVARQRRADAVRHSPFKSKWNFTLKLVIVRRIVPGLGSSCHCDPVTMCMCVSAGEEASFWDDGLVPTKWETEG